MPMALSHIGSPITPRISAGTATLPARTGRDGKSVRNLMLLTVPEDEFALLRPLLEPVALPRYKVLYDQGQKIEHAYFLNAGMISLVVIANDGRSVEVGISGREGVVGLPLAFGVEDAPTRAIVQMPGAGLRITSESLKENLTECPALRALTERYVLTQQMQVAQTAACNRLHDMEQRLARWLLMCQDTTDSGFLPLTHEFMAQMLGTGRPTVTIAAGVLERAGLIENTRGSVKILNRKRLEDAACECYGAIQSFRGNLALQ
jgi:CRP-like cAMP-binding protein